MYEVNNQIRFQYTIINEYHLFINVIFNNYIIAASAKDYTIATS